MLEFVSDDLPKAANNTYLFLNTSKQKTKDAKQGKVMNFSTQILTAQDMQFVLETQKPSEIEVNQKNSQ